MLCLEVRGVKIGNKVFIGMNTTILKGVHIGNNVIIGAGSLVNKDIPDDCVVAGNPVKVISKLNLYMEKRVASQIKEAKELVTLYRKVYNKEPGPEELAEFFWLWTDKRDMDNLNIEYKIKINLVGNSEYSYEKLKNHQKIYNNIFYFLRENKN